MRKLLMAWFLVLFTFSNVWAGGAPGKVIGATTADTLSAKKYLDKKFVFIDVRAEADFQKGRIPGAVNIVFETLTSEALAAKVKKDDSVVFYCAGLECDTGAAAVSKALEWGWTKVFYYREGYGQWSTVGLPIEK